MPFTPVPGPRLLVRDGDDGESRGTLARGLVELRRQGLFPPCDLPREAEWKFLAERIPAAHRPAVPLAQPGLSPFRRFPRRPEFAPSQGDPARPARSLASGVTIHRSPAATSPRAPGTRSFPSTWTPARANGSALSQPSVLFADRREHGQGRAAGHGATQRPLDRGAIIHRFRNLYGRNWEAIEHQPFLHFEVCYTGDRIRDSARPETRRGRRAGRAQARARLLAQTTYSAHYIADPGLRHAITEYLKRERSYIAEAGRELQRGRDRFGKHRRARPANRTGSRSRHVRL